MYDTKIKEIKDSLIELSEENQFFLIFKILRDCKDKELENRILKELSNDINDITKLSFILSINELFKQTALEENKDIKEKSLIHYKKILQTTKQLALEFKLNNSLELCNLYTYLLWNGYFSKKKKLIYQIENRKNINGMYWFDIINGYGACLNFSDMLTNFINEFDYSAATLANCMSDDCETSYIPKLQRNKNELSHLNYRSFAFNNDINHTFNLINENGKFYIYDSTNLLLAKLISHKQVDLLFGKGQSILKPYFSYIFNLGDKATNTLDLFNENMKFDCPYTITEYINEWEFCLKLFESNKDILNDFYNEIKNNVNSVLKIAKSR